MIIFLKQPKNKKNTSENIEVVGVLLFQDIIEELFQFESTISSYEVKFNIKGVQIDALLSNFKDSISLLLDNPELADETLIKTKLKEFVLLISKTQNAPSQLDFLSAMFKTNDTGFKQTIQQNLYVNLTIGELAHLCGMITSTFKRRFYEVFKESPKKYISKEKLEKASKMLTVKDIRISDVAYDCGYDSISTFNRAFKTYFGKSPSSFRVD